MAAGSHRSASRRHQPRHARRLSSAAIVAGPVSMSPLDWICPLLAIDADAFNHGGTPEFAAISAVALRHNALFSNALNRARPSSRSSSANPMAMSMRDPGARILRRNAAQAIGLGAAPQAAESITACCCRSCYTASTIRAVRCSDRPETGANKAFLRNAHTDIPAVVEAMRQYWMPTRFKTRS